MPNIEDLIKKAMQEGKFDDLPGKGKKLHLGETNPHANPDWELAYRMLKEAGYTLPWIEALRDIHKDLEAARNDLRRAWQHYKSDYGQLNISVYDKADWERANEAFRLKLEGINQRIRDYNLHVPAMRFQQPVLKFERELEKITQSQE